MSKKNKFVATQFVKSAFTLEQLGIADAEVAFVGMSNVGKSSLLNALCLHRQLAKVSKIPGSTRAMNVFSVKHGRWIVDLPGYGYAAVSDKEHARWDKMIAAYISGRTSLKAVFILVDSSSGIKEIDRKMMDWLKGLGLPCRVVATKIDRIPEAKLERLRDMSAGRKDTQEEIIRVSAKTGAGIDRLHTVISGLLGL